MVYILVALVVVVADIWLILKVRVRRASQATVANQLRAALACFALSVLSCLRFLTTELYYQKVIDIVVGYLSLLGVILFLWGIKYVDHNAEK